MLEFFSARLMCQPVSTSLTSWSPGTWIGVELFVVVPDVPLHPPPEIRDRPNQFRTSLNVSLHEQSLLWGEGPLLAEDWCELFVDLFSRSFLLFHLLFSSVSVY